MTRPGAGRAGGAYSRTPRSARGEAEAGPTLWDLIVPARRDEQAARAGEMVASGERAPERTRGRARVAEGANKPEAARAKPAAYAAMVQAELKPRGIRVRKWRKSMSGLAWELRYRDGTVKRLIESPYPRSPVSASIFLHEIGHHAIGLGVYRPRCLEEFHAWAWALSAMERHGIEITARVRARRDLSLWYAVDKARRRGLRDVPEELTPFLERPPRRPEGDRGGRSD